MTSRDSDILHGQTRRVKTGCGNLYVTANKNNKEVVCEVFIRLGKAGGCASSQTEALGRLITLALRCGSPLPEVVRQLSGIGCHQPVFIGQGGRVLSCADGVSLALKRLLPKEDISEAPIAPSEPCPDCGSQLVHEEGCQKCVSCGYTKC